MLTSKKYITFICIISWYAANIGVLLLNKTLLSKSFRQPVFLTTCHMLVCSFIGYLASYFNYFPLQKFSSKNHFYKVLTLSAVFCTTITLGNASLKYIPLSFNQVIGATTPFFTALVAFLLQGTMERFNTYLSLVPVVLGIAIASGGEPSFHILGFTFCILSASGRALKTVLQGILMKDPSDKLDPMSLLLYMSFFSSLLLIPCVVIIEPNALSNAIEKSRTSNVFLSYLLLSSCVAYLTNLLNFLVTKFTSPLTLQVLGNAKGVVVATISVLIFKNIVTGQGIFGYALTMTGVFLYAYNKRKGHALSSSANQNLRLLSKSLMFSASQHEHAENGVALVGGAAGLSNGVDVGGGVGNGTMSNDDGQANDMAPVSLSVVSVGLSATRVFERKSVSRSGIDSPHSSLGNGTLGGSVLVGGVGGVNLGHSSLPM